MARPGREQSPFNGRQSFPGAAHPARGGVAERQVRARSVTRQVARFAERPALAAHPYKVDNATRESSKLSNAETTHELTKS